MYFNKPETPNTWLSGTTEPVNSLGKNGDYYFDRAHKVIYAKEYGYWVRIISFGENTETCTIIFDLNDTLDGGPHANMPSTNSMSYPVIKYTYFSQNGYGDIPEPTREGYKFLGWYQTKVDPTNISPTRTPFTDMTPILSDMMLYACWEKIANN